MKNQPLTSGNIIIRDKDNATCSLVGPPNGSGTYLTYRFTDSNSPCPYDKCRTIQFDAFSSGTLIFLSDNDSVDEAKDQNFWMELITTRKRTSTAIIELDLIDTFQPGEIIRPGLMLKRKYRKNNDAQIRDALSGVRIQAPTSPPPLPATI